MSAVVMIEALEGTTLVYARSIFRRELISIEVKLCYDAFMHAFDLWQRGTLMQIAFPTLSSDEREFLITGITAEEWNTRIARN